MINQTSHTEQLNVKGSVLRVSGTIIDVQFPRESAPNILNELLIEIPEHGKTIHASIEVAQQLGDGIVRCIAIDNIFGISRGLGPAPFPLYCSSWPNKSEISQEAVLAILPLNSSSI